jgi:hypothetical protein
MRQRALAGDDCPRVGHLHLLDASADALGVARTNLADSTNVTFSNVCRIVISSFPPSARFIVSQSRTSSIGPGT